MNRHPAFTAGNVAVITGAADGIGRAAANRFASLGMHVVMADISAEKLESAAASVREAASGGAVVSDHSIDVANYEDLLALKSHAFDQFGQVDILMNNAGRSGRTSAWDALDTWHAIVDVNFWGIVNGVQAFTQAMLDQSRPALIVNTGSKQGITNPPGNPAYNASKAAVKAATESLQHALRNVEGGQVSAHLLVPGYTFTGLTRQRVSEKPAAAWHPEQVVEFMIEAIHRGSFYIICPDNEVTSADDAKRVLWGAGDVAFDRAPLSRWDASYAEQFAAYEPKP
jgi:NAD(P)-dependent dehydrogenase (short-subunit alcohol dehydrogenase family)